MLAGNALRVQALVLNASACQPRCSRARACSSRHASQAAVKLSSAHLEGVRAFRAVAESRQASAAGRHVLAVTTASAVKPLKDAEMKQLTYAARNIQSSLPFARMWKDAVGPTHAFTWSHRRPGIAPLLSSQPGVYAIYDKDGMVQYVGISRKVLFVPQTTWSVTTGSGTGYNRTHGAARE